MNRIARLIGLTLLLLCIFLAVFITSWMRLRQQTEQTQRTIIETRTRQLNRALALTRPASFPWTDQYVSDLNALLDARVVVITDPQAAPSDSILQPWRFDYPLQDDVGQPLATLSVHITPPPAARLGHLYRQAALALLCMALGLIMLLIFVLIAKREKNSEGEITSSGSSGTRHAFESLSQLAKVSVKQQEELAKEKIERLRATEDLHFQQILLNRSLEEKIQLGRELHDGIIQSLYATGLTFEAAKKHIAKSPDEAARQLEAGLKALNNTIRDVRGYISGLAPENLRQQTFSEAVLSLTDTLGSGRDVLFDLRIDEPAAAKLTDLQTANLLQIIRESISNGLRHGGARHITVRLHDNGDELALLVQDNGSGFDPAQLTARGHGLDNIHARANHIQAGVRIASTPGEGTRTIITLPILTGKIT